MNTVDVCLISSDTFLVALTLDSSSFAGTLEEEAKHHTWSLKYFFSVFFFPDEPVGNLNVQ